MTILEFTFQSPFTFVGMAFFALLGCMTICEVAKQLSPFGWDEVEEKEDGMIDSNEAGQKKLNELMDARDSADWNDWEQKFLDNQVGKTYASLTPKQKGKVGDLYDKLKGE